MDVITVHRLKTLGLDGALLAALEAVERARTVYRAFLEHLPYENLSNNREVLANPDEPDSWPRATDKVLRENQAHGFGGTSFSLAYALRDLLRGVGLTAHCTLGYNLVTEQAHAATLLYTQEGPQLFDPALLMCGPVPVRPGGVLEDPLGCIRLEPRCGPTLTVTLRMHCGGRPLLPGEPDEVRREGERAIYSIIPVPAPPQSFRTAWMASFYRGRRIPLRFARRQGDRILRYGERPGSIEILSGDRREEVPVGPDPAEHLHRVFGIDHSCLRAWFEGAA